MELETIPQVCLVTDVCRILKMSRMQFYALKRAGRWPLPEISPKLDRRPRYRGADVQLLIDGGLSRRGRRG